MFVRKIEGKVLWRQKEMKPKIDLEKLKQIIQDVKEKQLACSDGRCIWPKERGGMVTNGGCHCLSYKLEHKQRVYARAVFDTFKLVPDLIQALEEAKNIIADLNDVVSYDESGCPKPSYRNEVADEWLSRFEKEGE